MRPRSSAPAYEDDAVSAVAAPVITVTTAASLGNACEPRTTHEPAEAPKYSKQNTIHTSRASSNSTTTRRSSSIDIDSKRSSSDKRPLTAGNHRLDRSNWASQDSRNAAVGREKASQVSVISVPVEDSSNGKMPDSQSQFRRSRFRSPWSTSWATVLTTVVAIASLLVITHSFLWRQIDTKGCRMSYMRPAFAKLDEFDTEHTRFASKYSVYLYREQMVDEDTKVRYLGSVQGSAK